jgi:hypothetical protein
MDPPPDATYRHPEGRWHFGNSWSKKLENVTDPHERELRTHYFKPLWRWLDAVQNDFAARADWCVKDFAHANHHPVVRLTSTPLDQTTRPGQSITLDASPTTDPDGNALTFRWWHCAEAGTYAGPALPDTNAAKATIKIPADARPGDEFHLICEVTDSGTPALTRYARVVMHVTAP